MDEVLIYLVGPAPVPEQLEPEAEPDEEEKEAAIKLFFFFGESGLLENEPTAFFQGVRPRLKKKSPSASGEDLRKLADAEWLALGPDRRLHFVRKIRQRSRRQRCRAAAVRLHRVCSSAASLCPRGSWGGRKACRRCSLSVGWRAACVALARTRRRTGRRSFCACVGRARRGQKKLVSLVSANANRNP